MEKNCRSTLTRPLNLLHTPQSDCAASLPEVVGSTSPSQCGQGTTSGGKNTITSAAHNLELDALCARLGRFGPLEDQPCYLYVVETLELGSGDEVVQTASAPNFSGGFITLCTCKHDMRSLQTPEQWTAGVWVAGMTGSGKKFRHRQSLAFFMRVGEAYASQFDLVQALRGSKREATLNAKDACRNENGDVLIPQNVDLSPTQRLSAEFYHPPKLPHAHRSSADDLCWHEDIDHVDRWGRRPAYLVGDPDNSFTWSRQLILNTKPGNLRPHRAWTLADLVSQLAKFPS